MQKNTKIFNINVKNSKNHISILQRKKDWDENEDQNDTDVMSEGEERHRSLDWGGDRKSI